MVGYDLLGGRHLLSEHGHGFVVCLLELARAEVEHSHVFVQRGHCEQASTRRHRHGTRSGAALQGNEQFDSVKARQG